jgi:hypothetical protein
VVEHPAVGVVKVNEPDPPPTAAVVFDELST